MKRTKNKPTRKHAHNQSNRLAKEQEKIPFIEHVYELRKRLFYIAISVGIFGGLAASIQPKLTALLLAPAGKQQFIYTSPGGGFDFAFRLCLYAGIAVSIPVIVFHLLRYLQPLVKKQNMRFIYKASIWSGVLACLGILFGYFIGLPAGLHFLLQGFSSKQIQALISIQSYLSFVMVYLLGSALLFQIPLALISVNRIKPLKPAKLLKQTRWVILIAFVLGAIISPSPDIRNQAILSGPIIAMYELSVLMIWIINRKNTRPKKVRDLLQKDAEAQATRLSNFEKARTTWRDMAATEESPEPVAQTQAKPVIEAMTPPTTNPNRPQSLRPRRYAQDFTRRPAYRSLTSRMPQAE
ncbi:MAG TPA: twin-arginine translocase subunit TatC [Candidatus Saccharimonadales bacterium]|nr:twin-arginine translocase subunit TatC [Candidatus Saccharimonadales bacterium]